MTPQQIKDNAPEGATGYFEHTKNYLKDTNGIWCVWVSHRWLRVKNITYLFSIKDSIKPL